MAKATEQDEFQALLDEHRGILFKIANSYARTPADREDLVQEMVLQLWRSFRRYDRRKKFTTWMYRVALNVAISFCRSESRRRRTRDVDGAALDLAAESPAAPAPQDDLQLLHEFIARLNELDRALVILYLDGNRYDTIGEILGITETNVGTRIGRIKDKLRQMGTEYLKKEGQIWNSTN